MIDEVYVQEWVSEGFQERCSPFVLGYLCPPAPGWLCVGVPRSQCPHAEAGGLGAVELPYPARTMLLRARLAQCLQELFEIQIHGRGEAARRQEEGGKQSSHCASLALVPKLCTPWRCRAWAPLGSCSQMGLAGVDDGLGQVHIPEV